MPLFDNIKIAQCKQNNDVTGSTKEHNTRYVMRSQKASSRDLDLFLQGGHVLMSISGAIASLISRCK